LPTFFAHIRKSTPIATDDEEQSLTRAGLVRRISHYRFYPEIAAAAAQDADAVKQNLDELLIALGQALSKGAPSLSRARTIQNHLKDIKRAWRQSPLWRTLFELVELVIQDVEANRGAALYAG